MASRSRRISHLHAITPLIMSSVYASRGSYGLGLVLLALVALGCLALSLTVVRSTARAREVGVARV